MINLKDAGRCGGSRAANASVGSLRANDRSVERVLALVAADARAVNAVATSAVEGVAVVQAIEVAQAYLDGTAVLRVVVRSLAAHFGMSVVLRGCASGLNSR